MSVSTSGDLLKKKKKNQILKTKHGNILNYKSNENLKIATCYANRSYSA